MRTSSISLPTSLGKPSAPYDILEHRHRFAAWAASRAASVKGCRFSAEQGKAVLEHGSARSTSFRGSRQTSSLSL